MTTKQAIRDTDAGLEIDFVLSTGDIDRDYDTINPSGWHLEQYRKNPVVLWAHEATRPPIGKSLREWVEDDKLMATALFMPRELNPFAYSIGQMYKEGYLSAVSVGFRPLKYNWVEDTDRPFGIDFEEQELLEFSAVPVPANPDALVAAKSAGIDMAPIIQWAEEVIETTKDPQAIAIRQSLVTKTISIPGKIKIYKSKLKLL